VDRITSRQLLDQQLVETKVGELLQRQSELTQRHQSLAPVLGRARPVRPGLDGCGGKRADLGDFIGKSGSTLAYASAETGATPFSLWPTRKDDAEAFSTADRADMMFVAINRSLRSIEADQMDRVETLADNAYETAEAIENALESAGLQVAGDFGNKDVGGPLVPVGGDPCSTPRSRSWTTHWASSAR
jgi:hypothetical protein